MIKAKNTVLADRIQKNRDCARSSCRVYASNLNRLHREFLSHTKYNHDLKWMYNNSDKLLTKLKKIDNINTQRNMLAASLVGFDLLGADKKRIPYVEQIGVLNKLAKKNAESGVRTPKQADKFIEWESILKLRRLLTRTVRLGRYYTRKTFSRLEFQTMQQNLVLHLYTQLPPVRNDWSDVQFLSENDWDDLSEPEKTSTNNLVLARGGYRIYWANYKTVKKHGVIMEVIPKKLQTVLKRHIKFLKEHFPENKHLLLTGNGTPMSRNLLTKFLQRLFNKHYRKKISTSALRSIFLSHKFSKKDLEEQRSIAKSMHHTPAVARDFYVKN